MTRCGVAERVVLPVYPMCNTWIRRAMRGTCWLGKPQQRETAKAEQATPHLRQEPAKHAECSQEATPHALPAAVPRGCTSLYFSPVSFKL